jgi:hypothetical protein
VHRRSREHPKMGTKGFVPTQSGSLVNLPGRAARVVADKSKKESVGISESKSGIGSVFPICSADGYAAVTRLTNAFSKKFENDWHAKRGPYKKRIAA